MVSVVETSLAVNLAKTTPGISKLFPMFDRKKTPLRSRQMKSDLQIALKYLSDELANNIGNTIASIVNIFDTEPYFP